MAWAFKYEGLEEFKKDLRNLPHELADDGADIVFRHARSAFVEIMQTYPERTGNLKKGMRFEESRGQFFTSVMLVNKAKHAYLFENGTELRKTDLGWPRGKMPPGRVFVRLVIKWRLRMWRAFATLMRDHGLVVHGSLP